MTFSGPGGESWQLGHGADCCCGCSLGVRAPVCMCLCMFAATHVCTRVCVCTHVYMWVICLTHLCTCISLICVHVCNCESACVSPASACNTPIHVRRTPEIQEVTGERTRSQGQGPLGPHECWGQSHRPAAESLQTHQPKVTRLMLSRPMARHICGSLSRAVQ